MIRKKTWERKEIVTLPPLYTQAPGSIHTIPLVIIYKGVEVVVIGVSSPISAASVWLGKWIDWAVIDHMPRDVASSTDLKVADVVRMSPSMTKITLGCQTMMCRVAWSCLSAS